MGGFAWVTLATNDSYSLGALVLAHSLRRAGTKHDLAVLITPGVTQVMRDKLATVFSLVQEVNVLDSKEEANLALLARPELGITFTKLHCWRLTQYEKCVFVDADALVIRNCDELFEREELSAAPDVGWPDCFNSGVFVFQPSQQTFASITAFAAEKGSFDGGDQGLLNSYFSDWAHKDIAKHLPFIYNMCSTATYSYLPAYKQYGENARIIHFIGATKPWLQYFDTETGIVHPPSGCNHLQPLLQLWWNIFCENVHSQLSPVMARSTLAPIWHRFTPSLPGTPAPSYPIYNDSSHYYSHRSEQLKNDNDYDYYDNDGYNDKPADFSEFHDPWEHYIPKSTNMENIVFHQQTYHIDQYYDDVKSNQQHQYQVSPQQNYQSPSISHITDNYRSHQSFHSTNSHENRFENQIYSTLVNQNHSMFQPQIHLKPENFHHDYQYNSGVRVSQEEHVEHNVSSTDFSDSEIDRNHENGYNGENYRLQKNVEAFTCNAQEGQHETDYFENRNNIEVDDRLHRELIRDDNERLGGDSFHSRDYGQTAEPPAHSSSQSLSHEPCTDPLHNVAQHNDQSIDNQGNPATEEAGIAGALAKMTLGEPRSIEQIALEEHMRRQGWEQGQIDYMGRDSFENIWKKICDTLSQGPPREPSPPKSEETSKTESSHVPDTTPAPEPSPLTATQIEAKADSSEPFEDPTATMLQHTEIQPSECETIEIPTVQNQPEIPAEEKVESAEPEHQLEAQSLLLEETISDTDIAPKETIVPVQGDAVKAEADLQSIQFPPIHQFPVAPEEKTPALLEPEVSEKTLEDVTSVATPEVDFSSEAKVEQFISTLGVAPAVETLLELVGENTESASESSELILDNNSVPIQVAESVLQSEPKESVSEEQKPVREEIISSVVASVLESATAVSETVAEPREVEERESSVASGTFVARGINNGVDATPKSQAAPTSKDVETPTAAREPEAKELAPLSEQKPEVAEVPVVEPKPEVAEVPVEEPKPEVTEVPVEEPKLEVAEVPVGEPKPEVAKVPIGEPKPEVAKVPIGEPKPEVGEAQVEEMEDEPLTPVSSSSKSSSLTPPDSPTTESPVRPARTKDFKVPTTPTVTEATPPNSPPIGPGQSLDDPPKTVKKVIKKVVKKVPAESESGDGAEGETSSKKVVRKVIKKVVKKPKEATDEGAEASGTEKPKKIVKIVKKIVKPSESLEVDASVPETPPAGVPVPPKRKTKTTTTTTVTTTTTKNFPAEAEP